MSSRYWITELTELKNKPDLQQLSLVDDENVVRNLSLEGSLVR